MFYRLLKHIIVKHLLVHSIKQMLMYKLFSNCNLEIEWPFW